MNKSKIIASLVGLTLSSALIVLAYNNQSIVNTKNSYLNEISKLTQSIAELKEEQKQSILITEKMNVDKERLTANIKNLNEKNNSLSETIKNENLNLAMLRAEQTNLTLKIANSQTTLKATDAQIKVLENMLSGMKDKSPVDVSVKNDTEPKNLKDEQIQDQKLNLEKDKIENVIPKNNGSNLIKVKEIESNNYNKVVLTEKNKVDIGKVVIGDNEELQSKVVKQIY